MPATDYLSDSDFYQQHQEERARRTRALDLQLGYDMSAFAPMSGTPAWNSAVGRRQSRYLADRGALDEELNNAVTQRNRPRRAGDPGTDSGLGAPQGVIDNYRGLNDEVAADQRRRAEARAGEMYSQREFSQRMATAGRNPYDAYGNPTDRTGSVDFIGALEQGRGEQFQQDRLGRQQTVDAPRVQLPGGLGYATPTPGYVAPPTVPPRARAPMAVALPDYDRSDPYRDERYSPGNSYGQNRGSRYRA